MKYLKAFNNETEYQNFIQNGGEEIIPHIFANKQTNSLNYKSGPKANNGSNESTTFGFPLYLVTQREEIYPAYTYRYIDYNSLLGELITWCEENAVFHSDGAAWYEIDENILEENQIFIDGYQINNITREVMWGSVGDDWILLFKNGYDNKTGHIVWLNSDGLTVEFMTE